MGNITKQKRDEMLKFLEQLKKEHSDDPYIGSVENCNQSANQDRVLGCRSRFPTPGNLCHFGSGK